MAMIKAVIFDCYGVLTTGKWQAFWSSLPSSKQQEEARKLNRAYDGGYIGRADFFAQLSNLTNITEEKISQELLNDQYEKNIQLLELIKSLKYNYKISILSNIATNWIKEEFLTAGEQKLFNDMLFSFEVGITKPDPRIFKLACARLGVAPEECVLVDDIARYCSAAEALGMKAVVYQNFEQFRSELEEVLRS